MSSNPSVFAARVLAAFAAAGNVTDEEVAAAGGPSTTTLAKYRKVAAGQMPMAEPRGDSLRRIDQAAHWKTGSARALWRSGREPEPSEVVYRPRLERVSETAQDERYVRWLAERITELEDRLDLLESRGGEYDVAAHEDAEHPPGAAEPDLP